MATHKTAPIGITECTGAIPDRDNLIHAISGHGASWTATQECVMTFALQGIQNVNHMYLYVNGVLMASSPGISSWYWFGQDSAGNLTNGGIVGAYIKPGTTVSLSGPGCNGNVHFWGLKRVY